MIIGKEEVKISVRFRVKVGELYTQGCNLFPSSIEFSCEDQTVEVYKEACKNFNDTIQIVAVCYREVKQVGSLKASKQDEIGRVAVRQRDAIKETHNAQNT